jgi:site-specific recombinase XerC
VAGYTIVVRKHLIPALGRKRLDRLSAHDVRRLVGAKREAGLSVRMIQMIHGVLRDALAHAVREELLTRNVAKLVQIETPDYDVGQGLTVTEAQNLLAKVKGSRWHACTSAR